MGARTFTAGQEVVIPARPWNPTGVEATGYQLVPILCYHNLGPQSKGRLLLGAPQFEQRHPRVEPRGGPPRFLLDRMPKGGERLFAAAVFKKRIAPLEPVAGAELTLHKKPPAGS